LTQDKFDIVPVTSVCLSSRWHLYPCTQIKFLATPLLALALDRDI